MWFSFVWYFVGILLFSSYCVDRNKRPFELNESQTNDAGFVCTERDSQSLSVKLHRERKKPKDAILTFKVFRLFDGSIFLLSWHINISSLKITKINYFR